MTRGRVLGGIVQDFIGQPITKGSWVVNSWKTSQFGHAILVLHRVERAEAGSMKLTRLRVNCLRPKDRLKATAHMETVSDLTKYVVVTPAPAVMGLFERVVDGTATPEDHALCGEWFGGHKQGIWT